MNLKENDRRRKSNSKYFFKHGKNISKFNCTKNTVYKICNHTVQKTEIIPEELINKEEKDIEQYYKDWQIKSSLLLRLFCIWRKMNIVIDIMY